MSKDIKKRFGYSLEAGKKLRELLTWLNESTGDASSPLEQFDILRFVIAIAIQDSISPEPIVGKKEQPHRYFGFDPDGIIYDVLETYKHRPKEVSVYDYVEWLADDGINKMYDDYIQQNSISFDKYLKPKPTN